VSKSRHSGRHRDHGRHRDREGMPATPRASGPRTWLSLSAAVALIFTATGAHLGQHAAPALDGAATWQAVTPAAQDGDDTLAPLAQDLAAQDLAAQDLAAEPDDMRRLRSDPVAAQAREGMDQVSRGTERRYPDRGSPAGAGSLVTATATATAPAPAAPASVLVPAAPAPAAPASVPAPAAPAAAPAPEPEAGGLAPAADPAAHRWVLPLDGGYLLTSGFGMRWGAMHPGQDFATAVGTQVRAMSSGTVLSAGWEGGYGNRIVIQYWDGTVSWYCHNSALIARAGDPVAPGQVVSLSGNSGHSTGPHVHLEIHPDAAAPVPPLAWLAAKGLKP
jgi:murein DD-endopeptidase MepM/ murein hydrolase activator NlpD